MNLDLKYDKEFEAFLILKESAPCDHNGIYYIFRFPNNYGVSIVKGFGTYGVENDLWEIGIIFYAPNEKDPYCWDFSYMFRDEWGDSVKGYLTDEEVNDYLKKVKAYKEGENDR